MNLVMLKFTPRESGVVVGEWEIWKGTPEPEIATGSTLLDLSESSPYPS